VLHANDCTISAKEDQREASQAAKTACAKALGYKELLEKLVWFSWNECEKSGWHHEQVSRGQEMPPLAPSLRLPQCSTRLTIFRQGLCFLLVLLHCSSPWM
jgi:hypothetical protein